MLELIPTEELRKSKISLCDEAIIDYDKAIVLDPNYADAYYNRGNVKSELGQLEAAIEDYDKAICLKKNDAGGVY